MRNIRIQGTNGLTKENYIEFINQCYQAWQFVPVKDVDLIVEYQINDNDCALVSNSNKYVWGMHGDNISIYDMMDFAEKELHCEHYIIARIQDSNIRDFGVIK